MKRKALAHSTPCATYGYSDGCKNHMLVFSPRCHLSYAVEDSTVFYPHRGRTSGSKKGFPEAIVAIYMPILGRCHTLQITSRNRYVFLERKDPDEKERQAPLCRHVDTTAICRHQGPVRRIPNFFIFEYRVDLFKPRISAAPPRPATRQRVFSSTARISLRIMSSRLPVPSSSEDTFLGS